MALHILAASLINPQYFGKRVGVALCHHRRRLISGRTSSITMFSAALLTGAIVAGIAGCNDKDSAQASVTSQEPPPAPAEPARPQPDRTGGPRVGVASFYAGWFAGREMANGAPMDPAADNAASRTLPLGTTAKVTNISTGESTVVTIQDRGYATDCNKQAIHWRYYRLWMR